MYPKFATKIECLESFIGIRSHCATDKDYAFYLEDIEGVDIKALAAMAKASDMTGEAFGKFLVNSAAREMMGDIELLLNNGYRMKEVIQDTCSTCSLAAIYTANTGIVIKSNTISRFGIMRITKMSILVNRTGELQFKIDDGVDPKTFTANFVAGVVMPVVLEYTTTQQEVRVTFVDITVGLGKVQCQTQTSCGCGSSSAGQPVTLSGLSAGIATTNQYGFLPCMQVTCSYDTLICRMAKTTPNIFGLTLLYKTGEKYFLHKAASERNNATVSFNEEEKSELVRNYGRLYWAKMNGGTDRRGVKNVLNNYLKDCRSDKCIICENKIGTSYVTG